MALFLVPPDFNPWDTLAARFWSVRGSEQAGDLIHGKEKGPATCGLVPRASLTHFERELLSTCEVPARSSGENCALS